MVAAAAAAWVTGKWERRKPCPLLDLPPVARPPALAHAD